MGRRELSLQSQTEEFEFRMVSIIEGTSLHRTRSVLRGLVRRSELEEGMTDTKKLCTIIGVPIVAQWLTNLTSIHEEAGSIPDLTHWVKNPALP